MSMTPESDELYENDDTPLPRWVEVIRDHQAEAVDQVLEAYDNGAQVVFLDGPTGTGKTLIAELIRRIVGGWCLYVCSDKSLQDQFVRDFPYAKVLKGRANYPTQSNPNATAADCTANKPSDPCFHCDGGKQECPYEIAKREALAAPLAVTNIAYLLAEANYVGNFSDIDLIIVDEADTLESMLMNFVEFRIAMRYMEMVRMSPPVKGARKTTIIAWLKDFLEAFDPMTKAELDLRRKRQMTTVVQATKRVIGELEREQRLRQDPDADDEDKGLWMRQYERDETFVMKPVLVSQFGTRNLWRHGHKFLVMSATLISSDEMADSTGLPLEYDTVIVPMTFPVEHRPIILAPVANVTYKEIKEGDAVDQLAYAIQAICLKHAKDRILIHTVSYDLTEQLRFKLRKVYPIGRRNIVTYTKGSEREGALRDFKAHEGSVMLAPSMERGIDLPDDACRVQIIAKCPFPSLGDRQVSARTHMHGGEVWYAVQTIRDIVQMAGRGVRHKDDWCVTYILDKQFTSNLWRKWKRLFPSWFQDAVLTREDIRWMMRQRS